MSQKDESENDIWEYKPLVKKRRNNKSPCASKRRYASEKTSKKNSSLSLGSQEKGAKTKAAESGDSSAVGDADDVPIKSPAAEIIQSGSNAGEKPTSEDYCPICQMPFCILVVQSQRWHVAECLDTPRDKCKECPDGLQCSSTIPIHYKRLNHTLLAESRANSNTATTSLSWQTGTFGEPSIGWLQENKNNEMLTFPLDSSQGSDPISSSISSQGASPQQDHTATPLSKPTNGLLLLRSPGPEDFKKKKGWLGKNKGQQSVGALQGKTEVSSPPVKENTTVHACESSTKEKTFLKDDDGISYSPLSELPAEPEVSNNCTKSLFLNEGSDHEHSVILFNDSFSSEDEILADFVDNNWAEGEMALNDPSSSSSFSSVSQLDPVSSLAPTNQQADPNKADAEACVSSSKISSSSLQSPQSIVLERLRESLPCSEGESKAGQASGLKQTDIGVFFGLKPLKEKESESGQNNLGTTSVSASGKNPGRRRRGRDGQVKSKADPAADVSQATGLGNDSSSVGAQGEAGKGGNRGWRRRWNRENADGEVQLPRCPFYKKIPGQ
ncbi:hypothetical protein ATANTOWER_002243 [Ataeniobius toweri]|uniref:C2H2-type domain-containing protein n=1 Tax=Ataeniobius toweri TaxID=208326 RepID=A0ABU7C7A7_9TELE|nr:hypothetical protein [Ataeniobius toweri]